RLHRAHDAVLLHHAAEVDPVEQLHGDVRALIELAGGEHLDHVRVADCRHRARLAHEAGAQLVVLAVPLAEDLDGDLPVEIDVHAAHHVAHRAGADGVEHPVALDDGAWCEDRKSTRLNSSHVKISYAVFCLKKKKSRH